MHKFNIVLTRIIFGKVDDNLADLVLGSLTDANQDSHSFFLQVVEIFLEPHFLVKLSLLAERLKE